MVSFADSLKLAFRATLQQLDPAQLTHRYAEQLDPGTPHVLIAVGKAAPAMARGAIASRLPIHRAVVVTTDGTPADDLPDAATVLRAAHPVPDARSVQAAELVLAIAHGAPRTPLLVLVSGGASALLCAPAQGLSLGDKQRLTDALLRSGANIREVNTVRRHLSRIKGGHLAAAGTSVVHTAIISDVVDGAPHDVGSGPACADPTTCAQARDVLRMHLHRKQRNALVSRLRESVKPDDAVASRTIVAMLCGPTQLAEQMAAHLHASRLQAHVEHVAPRSAIELAQWLVARASTLQPGGATVVACEPTLRLPQHHGRGGRAGRVALAALPSLPAHTALLAGASDGVDGNSGTAGACVTAEMRTCVDAGDVQRALADHDDGTVHAKLGSHLGGGPTGLNLSDVYVVARRP